MTNYRVQIDNSEYSKDAYQKSPLRWSTHALVIQKVLENKPKSILEIGPGNGTVTKILKNLNFEVTTLDFDNEIKPDITMDITSKNFGTFNRMFDLIIASEILEHIQYHDFIKVLKNMIRIAPSAILTLPYSGLNSHFLSIKARLPFVKKVKIEKKIYFKKTPNKFNGQHYWEIGKVGFSLKKIKNDIIKSGWDINKNFFNTEYPYHYFFVLKNNDFN